MKIYDQFAKVYNTFMGDTPYDEWATYIKQTIKKYEIDPQIMCELGCGTGIMCELFAKEGIELIGIDNAPEMLMQAQQNAVEKDLDILYLLQDMSEFELYGTVDVIYSCCDSINYLLEEQQVLNTFKLANNYLEKQGLFIFDMNTPYKYKNVLGARTFAEQTEDAAYIWENYYDENEQVNEFSVNFFIKGEDELYERSEEVHYQRAYSIEKIKDLLEQAGLELLEIVDEYSNDEVQSQTQRVTFIAREKAVPNKVYK